MRKIQEKLHDPEFYLGTVAIIVAAIVLLLSLLVSGCTAPAAQIEGDGQTPQVIVVAGGDGGVPIPEFEVLSIKGEGEFTFSVLGQVMHVEVAATHSPGGVGPCATVGFRWTLIQLTTDYPKGCSSPPAPKPQPAQVSDVSPPTQPSAPSPSPDLDTTP